MNQPRYTKEDKQTAVELNAPLFALDIDERHVKDESGKRKGRRRTIQGIAVPGWLFALRYARFVLDREPQAIPQNEHAFGPFHERDLETLPFNESEARVARYLAELAPEIGVGPDPVGFLIASHAALAARQRDGE